jgi:hypothetical protein
MNTLIFQIDKMGVIVIVNNSSENIHVSVTATGGDFGKGGSESWYTLEANGGRDTWGYRSERQVIRFTRSLTPGATVETILGVPNTAVYIN